MKILEVTPTFPPAWSYGGIPKVVFEITKELSKRGHDVEVWTSDAFDLYSRVKNVDVSTVRAGARIHYFKNLSFTLTRVLNIHVTPSIVMTAKEDLRNFDVVHLHGARIFQNAAVYPYAKKYGVPYVFQAHGSLPRTMVKRRLKGIYDVLFGYRLLKNASRVVALSGFEAEQYRRMGVPEEKIAVIPNGIDLAEYADLPPIGSFKRKFGIPEDKKVILYLGRIHKTKGIDFLVKAHANLVKKMRHKDALLVIAGRDDGYLGEVRQLVNHLKVADKVLIKGMLSEKEKIDAYVDSSLVVNVEPRNVFGLVPLEAAACSTPVVVSKGNAISESVHKGKFGFSVKYGRLHELAKITDKVLDNDDLAKKMGQNGREFIFENYNWANIITKLEKVYEESAWH